MKNKFLLYHVMGLVFLLFLFPSIFAEVPNKKWINISGNWVIRKDNRSGYLIETRGKTYKYGYNEIINNNGLRMINPLERYEKINFNIMMLRPTVEPVYSVVFLGGESDKDLFFIKFSGDATDIKKITLVSSRIIDTTKPRREKWNYLLSEIAAKDISLHYNTEFEVTILTKKKKIEVMINNKEVLKIKLDYTIDHGFLGFGDNNCFVRIRDFKVYNDDTIVFKDDFSLESIKKLRMVVEKVSNKK